jgi:hypothetical protein
LYPGTCEKDALLGSDAFKPADPFKFLPIHLESAFCLQITPQKWIASKTSNRPTVRSLNQRSYINASTGNRV